MICEEVNSQEEWDIEPPLTIIHSGSEIQQGVRTGIEEFLVVVSMLLEAYHSEPERELAKGVEEGSRVDAYR